MKPRMTKQRARILEKLATTTLAWGYGEQGGKEYFFGDGAGAKSNVVEGMLNCGLLKQEESPLGGLSQNITREA